jgi:hypothetical protein
MRDCDGHCAMKGHCIKTCVDLQAEVAKLQDENKTLAKKLRKATGRKIWINGKLRTMYPNPDINAPGNYIVKIEE